MDEYIHAYAFSYTTPTVNRVFGFRVLVQGQQQATSFSSNFIESILFALLTLNLLQTRPARQINTRSTSLISSVIFGITLSSSTAISFSLTPC